MLWSWKHENTLHSPMWNRKIWDKNPKAGPTKAECVYIRPFAKKFREYAMRFHPSSWYILSAKYGFLFPVWVININGKIKMFG